VTRLTFPRLGRQQTHETFTPSVLRLRSLDRPIMKERLR
jgi:hypothetical protein